MAKSTFKPFYYFSWFRKKNRWVTLLSLLFIVLQDLFDCIVKIQDIFIETLKWIDSNQIRSNYYQNQFEPIYSIQTAIGICPCQVPNKLAATFYSPSRFRTSMCSPVYLCNILSVLGKLHMWTLFDMPRLHPMKKSCENFCRGKSSVLCQLIGQKVSFHHSEFLQMLPDNFTGFYCLFQRKVEPLLLLM